MSDPGKPIGFSPTRTLVASIGGVTVRIKRRAQLAIVRALAPLAVKLVIAGIVALAAVLAWEC